MYDFKSTLTNVDRSKMYLCLGQKDMWKYKWDMWIFRFKNNEYTPIAVTHGSVQKQFVLLTLEGVDTLEAAVAMKNEIIYADREDFHLGEGDFFIADIIGLPVIDVDDGKKYGTLKDVLNSGSSDIYEIATDSGDVMIPAVAEFIIKVTPEDAIYIRPIPGMFDW